MNLLVFLCFAIPIHFAQSDEQPDASRKKKSGSYNWSFFLPHSTLEKSIVLDRSAADLHSSVSFGQNLPSSSNSKDQDSSSLSQIKYNRENESHNEERGGDQNLVNESDSRFKIVCYFRDTDYGRVQKFEPEDIDSSLCTHIHYGVAFLDSVNKTIKSDEDSSFFSHATAHKNKDVKVLVTIGGRDDSYADELSKMSSNPDTRFEFVSSVLNFIEDHNFDGLDLTWLPLGCWETSCQNGSRKNGFSDLIRELRAAFKRKGFLLTATVSSDQKIVDEYYDVPVLNEYLDYINIITFNTNGNQSRGHVAPLYQHPEEDENSSVDFKMNYWLHKGAEKQKLNMVIPFFGFQFTQSKSDQLKRTFTKAYYQICIDVKTNGWNVIRDNVSSGPERRGPFATKNDQWIGFDDARTVRQKSEYIQREGFGGVVAWSLDMDDQFVCGCEKYPLLRTMNRVLRNLTLPDPGCDLRSTPSRIVKSNNNVRPVTLQPSLHWVLTSQYPQVPTLFFPPPPQTYPNPPNSNFYQFK